MSNKLYEIEMMESATEINQEFANYLLYQAWHNWHMAQITAEYGEENCAWYGYWESANNLYKAWSVYTGIEFVNGMVDLDKFTDEDFNSINLML